jgi:hypothetical protein
LGAVNVSRNFGVRFIHIHGCIVQNITTISNWPIPLLRDLLGFNLQPGQEKVIVHGSLQNAQAAKQAPILTAVPETPRRMYINMRGTDALFCQVEFVCTAA